jgi:hypothetical protein
MNILSKSAIFTFLFLVFISINSCKERLENDISSKSPNGQITLSVTGEKFTLDPWKVSISAKKGDSVLANAQIELIISDLSNKTVVFDWQNDSFCYIKFLVDDQPPRFVSIKMTETGVLIHEE